MSQVNADAYKDRSGGDGATIAGVNTAKAWVNFDGTGTVSVRDDYNVDSITDDGTGTYTVNFTDDLTDNNFSAVGAVEGNGGAAMRAVTVSQHTTSSFVIRSTDLNETAEDQGIVSGVAFGGGETASARVYLGPS